MERKRGEQHDSRVIWHQCVSKHWAHSNYQPLYQQKQSRTYRKGSTDEDCCYLLLEYVFLSWWSSWGFPFFPAKPPSCSPFLPAVIPSGLDGNDVLAEKREREDLERLDQSPRPSDQSAIDMTTLYCFEPIALRSQHVAERLLVGWIKTSHLKLLRQGAYSPRPAYFTHLRLHSEVAEAAKNCCNM